ncbi:MAG: alpha-ketoacid dehydrogenase subunit beta [Armatimonadetes bacterium]|nr:alpha-ketoacid dehydrogenase subunit beta [Armatimonadota bacterium]
MPVMNMVTAVNAALRQEMRRDDRVVVLGEDVGVNGGVFRATEGLYQEFGGERVIDTPLTESGIVGAAVGMALYGLRPVPEIQFLDFIYPAFDQVVSEMAKYRYRSGGQYTCPVVLRTPYGGGVRGGHYHSQSTEAYFCHTPGLVVIVPSTPYDTKGLLTAALRGEDPVIFLEPKRLYRATKDEVPDDDYVVPIGKARTVREGSHLTLICYGAMVPVAEEAAAKAAEHDVEVEVIDLRTLVPLDVDAIIESVKKTGRVVILHEAAKTGGFGGEIAALIAERAVDSLEAPIVRVAGYDTPFPYTLEHLYMPDVARVSDAIKKVVEYH